MQRNEARRGKPRPRASRGGGTSPATIIGRRKAMGVRGEARGRARGRQGRRMRAELQSGSATTSQTHSSKTKRTNHHCHALRCPTINSSHNVPPPSAPSSSLPLPSLCPSIPAPLRSWGATTGPFSDRAGIIWLRWYSSTSSLKPSSKSTLAVLIPSLVPRNGFIPRRGRLRGVRLLPPGMRC